MIKPPKKPNIFAINSDSIFFHQKRVRFQHKVAMTYDLAPPTQPHSTLPAGLQHLWHQQQVPLGDPLQHQRSDATVPMSQGQKHSRALQQSLVGLAGGVGLDKQYFFKAWV